MSVRSTPRSATAPAQTPIEFRSDFVNSPAALQANHEETMGKLLSRLDQLQAKISTQGESSPSSAPSRVVFKTKPLIQASASSSSHSELHER